VIGVLHTGLTVSDRDRSIAFYSDLLGLNGHEAFVVALSGTRAMKDVVDG
jgi:catechol 2,3-dioxygenase-like lactoylglutathione lyase family enzyme